MKTRRDNAVTRHPTSLRREIASSHLFSYFLLKMKASAKAKGKSKEVPFDPIFFAASVPARKPTAKDLKDVKEHKNDPIDRDIVVSFSIGTHGIVSK
jgi:hypothetical protein